MRIKLSKRKIIRLYSHLSFPHIYELFINFSYNLCKKKVKVLATSSCPTLCYSMDYSLPGSSVHRILQARILQWVAIPFSRGFSQPRDWTWVSCLAGRFFLIWATREVLYCLMRMLLTQLCPVLCNLWTVALQDPGFSVHGILQARILQWVVIPFSRGIYQPRYRTCTSQIFVAGRFFTFWVTWAHVL